MENLKTIKFNELMAKQFPKDIWLVKSLIPENCITMISGSPSSFKTFLMLDLVICMATGNKFLGEFEVKKTKILFIDEENGERMLQKRLKQLTSEQELDIEILSYSGFQITDSDKIIAYCLENKIEVIILDSLIRIHSNEENSSTEMSKLFNDFKKYKIHNLSVIFTHHNRKTGQNRLHSAEDARGSSEILAFIDAGISVYKDDDKNEILINPTKLRINKEAEPFKIRIAEADDSSWLRFEFSGEVKKQQKTSKPAMARGLIIALLSENGEQELYQKTIIDDLNKKNIGESTVKTTINNLIAENLLRERKGKGNTKFLSLTKPGENLVS